MLPCGTPLTIGQEDESTFSMQTLTMHTYNVFVFLIHCSFLFVYYFKRLMIEFFFSHDTSSSVLNIKRKKLV